MRNKLYAGLMILALAVSLGTLFFAMQPSVEAGDGKDPVQSSAPPPPPPSCQYNVTVYCTGPVGSGGCSSSRRPALVITTYTNCFSKTVSDCALPSECDN